jgi:hypothetical protein
MDGEESTTIGIAITFIFADMLVIQKLIILRKSFLISNDF